MNVYLVLQSVSPYLDSITVLKRSTTPCRLMSLFSPWGLCESGGEQREHEQSREEVGRVLVRRARDVTPTMCKTSALSVGNGEPLWYIHVCRYIHHICTHT